MSDPVPLHIDTDPGVDDLLALGMTVASPEVRVVGVTTVAGNAPLDAVTENARRFVELAGLAIPVGRGAARPLRASAVTAAHMHGADGRGGVRLPEPARDPGLSAAEVFRTSLGVEGARLLLALGPLTNVARLLADDPELLRGVEIVWMGGTLGKGNVTEAAEFNCYVDPDAADRVLASGLPVRVVGLEVTTRVTLSEGDLDTHSFGLCERGRVIRDLLASLMRAEGAAILHDPCAAAAVVAPSRFRFEARRLGVLIEEGAERGRLVARAQSGSPRVRYATQVQSEAVTKLCLERLRAFSQNAPSGAYD